MSSSGRWEGRRRRAPGARAPPASRDKALDDGPEAARMVELDQVRHLVRDHVVGKRRLDMHQAPGQPDRAALGADAPLGARVGQRDARRGQAEQRREMPHAWCHRFQCRELEPFHHESRTLGAQRLAPSRLTGPVPMRSSNISPNNGRRSPLTPRRRTGLSATDHSSSLARIQCSFSRTKPSMSRHGARSGADDLQAVGVDRDAEGAPPPSHEAVFHFPPGEPDEVSAVQVSPFCCSSIHVLASSLMV